MTIISIENVQSLQSNRVSIRIGNPKTMGASYEIHGILIDDVHFNGREMISVTAKDAAVAEVNHRLEAVNAELIRSQGEVSDLKSRVAAAEGNAATLDSSRDELKADIANLIQDHAERTRSLNQTIGDLSDQLATKCKELDDSRRHEARRSIEIRESRELIRRLTDSLAATTESLVSVTNDLEAEEKCSSEWKRRWRKAEKERASLDSDLQSLECRFDDLQETHRDSVSNLKWAWVMALGVVLIVLVDHWGLL